MLQPCVESLAMSDGYRTAVRWWRPPEPRGAVLYFHGIQSHGGWYEMSGSRLAEAGLTVLMPDRRGSGLNREQRGHSPSVTRTVEDARECLDALLSASGHGGAHLVGVSWGGKLCVSLASHAPQRVRSMTLVAPGLFSKLDLPTLEKFRVAMSMVNDRERLFEIPLNDPRLFTANPERIEYVEADGLKLTRVSAGFLVVGRRLDRFTARFGQSGYRGAVHLMLAGQDRIIDNDRTGDWLRELPFEDRQITLYPEAHHTLEFEADPSAFLHDLVTWIGERCETPTPAETAQADGPKGSLC